MRIALIISTIVGSLLLGCQRDPVAQTPGEMALANLAAHVAPLRTATSYYRPVVCDNGGTSAPILVCYADQMQQKAGQEMKAGWAKFACATEPAGRCSYTSTVGADDAAGIAANLSTPCTDPLDSQSTFDLPGAGTVAVTLYETGEADGQAWASASITLQDAAIRLTEPEVNGALDYLGDRMARTCGAMPFKRIRIFLYPSGVKAGESANWIARFEQGAGRSVDLNRGMLKDDQGDRYACLDEKEPGKPSASGVKLPPERQRETIGTWVGIHAGITMSLERVQGKVYRVYRSAYCGSGDRGELLRTRSDASYGVADSEAGDYYQVTLSGDLGVFDRDGKIDVMLRHSSLYPTPEW